MSEELKECLSNYIQTRTGIFKKYLLAALDNKDHWIWYLESSEGMLVPSSGPNNCQLLRDAQLFTEDWKNDLRQRSRGSPENVPPTTAISGGSINIHVERKRFT